MSVYWRNRALEQYVRFVREVGEARLTRRELIKLGLVSAGALLGARAARAAGGSGKEGERSSPRVKAFNDPFRMPGVHRPVAQLDPAPTADPQPAAGEQRRARHQAFDDFPPGVFFEVRQREGVNVFHGDAPFNQGSYVWGFNGFAPGPTYHAFYGLPMLVRNHNDLPQENRGFGKPQVSTHAHNGHTPSESDGNPLDSLESSTRIGVPSFYDQHYPNVRAGFSQPELYGAGGDSRETMSTLFYHDHMLDFTSQNVHKGLVGFFLLFSDDRGLDTGDERTGLRLPGRFANGDRYAQREFDIPMAFADFTFDRDGQIFFDLFNTDGLLGDRFAVNGVIQPYLEVKRRKYRFRLLDAGPSRFYEFFVSRDRPGETSETFFQISNDGNLLPLVLERRSVRASVAERHDIVFDFSKYPAGTRLYLENRLAQDDGRGPEGGILRTGNPLVEFRVLGDPTPEEKDDSEVYAGKPLIPLPDRPADLNALRRRSWRFDRSGGNWTINNRLFDEDEIRAEIPRNGEEVWVFQNNSGGWSHPIHVHFEEYQVLSRNGRAIAAGDPEFARKDVVELGRNQEVRMFMRFRDFAGRYVMHCHNTIHEDHAMMLQWRISA
jgi:FtsP/CotA-like multicopper oxidase with cupredoxin domain